MNKQFLLGSCCWFFLYWAGNLQAQGSTAVQIDQLEKKSEDLERRQMEVITSLERLRLKKIREDLKAIGLPKVPTTCKDEVIEHGALLLSYNEAYEQANWVAHIIIPAVNKGNLSRTNDFRKDSLVSTQTAEKADYWYSGYDRGHLAPSADFRWSQRAISESYVYSNMAPQRPELNRERWAELEGFIRGHVWAKERQLYVVTGPVLEEGLPTITQGPNIVAIPKEFYKLVLDLTPGEEKAIAFLMPNGACGQPLVAYSTTVDAIETKTGLDFFSALDDGLEGRLEAASDFGLWEEKKEGEISTQKPLTVKERPKNTLNSQEVDLFVNKKACVCGTVVSARKIKNGSIFFNFDAKFPNHTFSGSIWGTNIKNFSYDPEIEFLGKKLCITGKISDYKGKSTMNIEHEKRVTFLDKTGKAIAH
ncbi:MAG: DNA/RNA non-specific endonuclease [Aureispira sp.]